MDVICCAVDEDIPAEMWLLKRVVTVNSTGVVTYAARLANVNLLFIHADDVIIEKIYCALMIYQ
jgi:hypothetical protein